MTEKDRVLAAITRIEAKRDAQTDPLCRRYYELCLIGWEAHLKRIGERALAMPQPLAARPSTSARGYSFIFGSIIRE